MEHAEAVGPPPLEALVEDVYETPPRYLRRQVIEDGRLLGLDQLGRLLGSDIQDLELGRRVDVLAPTRGEVIDHDDPMAPVHQGIHDMRADKPGPSNDKYF